MPRTKCKRFVDFPSNQKSMIIMSVVQGQVEYTSTAAMELVVELKINIVPAWSA